MSPPVLFISAILLLLSPAKGVGDTNVAPKILIYGQESFDSEFLAMLENCTGTELVFQRSSCRPYFDAGNFVSHFKSLLSEYSVSFNGLVRSNITRIIGSIVLDCSVPGIELLSHKMNIPMISSLSVAPDSGLNSCSHSMTLSASFLARGVSSLLRTLNWTRVGLVMDSLSSTSAVTAFLTTFREKNITISPYIDTEFGYSAWRTVQIATTVSSKIIYISVPDRKFICDILQNAFYGNMMWPHYAWIIYGHFAEDLIMETLCNARILEGVILVNQDYHSNTVNGGESSLSVVRNDLLYDSVEALLHSLKTNSCKHDYLSSASFRGRTGQINFIDHMVLRNIVFSQIVNGTLRKSALYTTVNDDITLIEGGFGPSSKLPSSALPLINVSTRTIPLAYSSTVIVLTFLFVTINLCLYICYRKEKEVKATSVSLSLLMFLGCYLNIAFLASLAVEAAAARMNFEIKYFNLCTLHVWLSGIALPITLILATLLIKMLRIYKLFKSFKRVNKIMYRDYFLAIFVLLLVSPNLLILTIFSTDVVKYKFEIKYVEFLSHIEVIKACTGDIDAVTTCLMAYLIVLAFAVCIVAIKSRKIRYKMFSDTKKVNAFLFVLILETVLAFSLWFIFEHFSEDNFASSITLYTGTVLVVLSCQVFLFLPKVLPPLKRSLSRPVNTHSNYSSESSKRAMFSY